MKNLDKTQKKELIATAVIYSLILIFYIANAIAVNSFLYGIYAFVAFILSSAFTMAMLYVFAYDHKIISVIFGMLFSACKLIAYFVFFFLEANMNIKAMCMRISGTATTAATLGDYVSLICTIGTFVLIIASVVLEVLDFASFRRKRILKAD